MLILLEKGICTQSPVLCNIQLYSVYFSCRVLVSTRAILNKRALMATPGLVTLDRNQLLASPTHTRAGPLLNTGGPKKTPLLASVKGLMCHFLDN